MTLLKWSIFAFLCTSTKNS